ncbi:MAG: JAB domain-containing protein [Candidatus Obscuribacterales bacterium]|nr:JAB domain-containing protein [Candidatus Obscuribacterales bacterium]
MNFLPFSRTGSVALRLAQTFVASMVHPREVFKATIVANSFAIIAAHNHPSGSLEPSFEDEQITRRLVEVGRILCIKCANHFDQLTQIQSNSPTSSSTSNGNRPSIRYKSNRRSSPSKNDRQPSSPWSESATRLTRDQSM